MIDMLTANVDATELKVTWETGEESTLPAGYLRENARDAWTIRALIDHGEIRVAEDLTITALAQVGNGVNIHFSDGHDRAIYPFPYLRELSERL